MTDEKRTIYIAGPMRGKPNWNYDAFNKAEAILTEKGWNVVNPATLDTNYQETAELNTTPNDFDPDNDAKHRSINRRIMKRDCDAICDECDAIFMLKGWQNSQGACAEFYLSCSIGLDIYYETSEGSDNDDRDCDPANCRSVSVG